MSIPWFLSQQSTSKVKPPTDVGDEGYSGLSIFFLSNLAILALRRFAVILFATILAQIGCTSIQWRDASGLDHHLGLFFYEIQTLNCGEQLKKTSLGIDVRFSGADRGISVGLKTSSTARPGTTVIEDPDELGNSVIEYMNMETKGCIVPSDRGSRSGAGYLVENITKEQTVIDTTNVGIELRRGPLSPGVNVGYVNNFGYTGRVLEEGVVQIHSRSKPFDALALWILKPFVPGIPVTEENNTLSERGEL